MINPLYWTFQEFRWILFFKKRRSKLQSLRHGLAADAWALYSHAPTKWKERGRNSPEVGQVSRARPAAFRSIAERIFLLLLEKEIHYNNNNRNTMGISTKPQAVADCHRRSADLDKNCTNWAKWKIHFFKSLIKLLKPIDSFFVGMKFTQIAISIRLISTKNTLIKSICYENDFGIEAFQNSITPFSSDEEHSVHNLFITRPKHCLWTENTITRFYQRPKKTKNFSSVLSFSSPEGLPHTRIYIQAITWIYDNPRIFSGYLVDRI